MQTVEPVFTIELFPGLSAELLGVLKGLTRADWEKPTACAGWSVHDVAGHLLGGSLSRLAFGRDRVQRAAAASITPGYESLLEFINQQNEAWVAACTRISPALMIEFIELTDPQLYQYFKSLPPFAPAGPAVAWAGETQSPVWFDIAREYTEKWLHQQHIREAVGQPILTDRQWMAPLFDTFMRALPHAYRDLDVPDGIAICFHITSTLDAHWTLLRQQGAWILFTGQPEQADTFVELDPDVAWRLFTKGITPQAALGHIHIQGQDALALSILQMVTIMA